MLLNDVIEAFFKNKRLLNEFNCTFIVHLRIVCTKNLYYILFKCYIKYKSEKRLYRARGGRDVMKFYSRWPARILFSASRLLCVYQSSPFCDHRKKERERIQSERKREPMPLQSIYEAPRPWHSLERIAICIFRKRLHAFRARPRQFESFCLHAVPFIRGCLPFDLIISFV